MKGMKSEKMLPSAKEIVFPIQLSFLCQQMLMSNLSCNDVVVNETLFLVLYLACVCACLFLCAQLSNEC